MKVNVLIIVLLTLFIIPSYLMGISILTNGSEISPISYGQLIVLTVTFSPGMSEATLSTWIDLNANNTLEEDTDHLFDSPVTIHDNDSKDENPTIGEYQVSFYLYAPWVIETSNVHTIFKVSDPGGSDISIAIFQPLSSNYSISGTVFPVISSLVVIAYRYLEMWDDSYATTANPDGTYTINVPEADQYHIVCIDSFQLTEGMLSLDEYENVFINGHLTDTNFTLAPATSGISGYLRDQDNMPVPYKNIMATDGTVGFYYQQTDANGYYHFTLPEENYGVRFFPYHWISNYLEDGFHFGNVTGTENTTLDLQVFEPDAFIHGTTYLDGQPVGGVDIYGRCNQTSSTATSDANGNYTLSTSQALDGPGGFEVSAYLNDPNVYCHEIHQHVLANTNNVDFHIHSIVGGFEGHVYDSTTGLPIHGSAYIRDYSYGFICDVDSTGYYHGTLTPGTYSIHVDAEDYYSNDALEYTVGDSMLVVDFNLVPVVFASSIAGHVYQSQTGIPIPNIGIEFETAHYTAIATTDETGYYHIQLPNGVYYIWTPGSHVATDTDIFDLNVTDWDFILDITNTDDPITPPVKEIKITNYPNPFNPETTIRFELPSAMKVKLDIMNIRGQLVKTLTSDIYTAGSHEIKWNGKDSNGKQVASGMYLYRISTSIKTITNKMLMLK